MLHPVARSLVLEFWPFDLTLHLQVWQTILVGGPAKLVVLANQLDADALKSVFIELDVAAAKATQVIKPYTCHVIPTSSYTSYKKLWPASP